MRLTSKEFSFRPAKAYRAADKGENVEITHAHYPDLVFELVAKKRDKDNETD